MRDKFYRTHSVLHFSGGLFGVLGLFLLLPILIVLIFWGRYGDGWRTVAAFTIPALGSFTVGLLLRLVFRPKKPDMTSAMLMCALGWLFASAVGAVPFVIGIRSSYLNGYFEAMSGFTTTGITVYAGLDLMPRSIIFWRALTQWLGGTGILSFFLLITFRGAGAHFVFGAESHKISSGRPAPGLFNTLKILWGIYAGFTVFSIALFALEGMPLFDSICHTFTALSTGGFSPYDASIARYGLQGHPHYRLIEYTVTFVMLLGGINFLVHYRVLTRDVRALWDNIEMRWWWGLLTVFTALIMIDHLHRAGALAALARHPSGFDPAEIERVFRLTVFQVVSILTTTGFGTQEIGSEFFPALSRQLFLAMMVIGGCVGSTGGGIKVLRVAILNRLMIRELFKLRSSGRTSTKLVIDGRVVPDEEVHRVAALFFTWMALLLAGGAVTALLSELGATESLSGMFSALGNIGPCYIPVITMIEIHPLVKITYIFGMLAGRLEILPLFLLFTRKAWQ
ncbi:MAG: TrkH family potassium uptake protein [Candidatus Krumholzibacteriota bacterium]|nr:TrkH family potassium uptake protein [Candidatus Krumholzibacteriota bacterium]